MRIKLCVDKLCDEQVVCENNLCVSKLCVDKLCDRQVVCGQVV